MYIFDYRINDGAWDGTERRLEIAPYDTHFHSRVDCYADGLVKAITYFFKNCPEAYTNDTAIVIDDSGEAFTVHYPRSVI